MLKKILLSALLLAFTAAVSYSQNLSLGLKAGGSIVKMDFEGTVQSYQTHLGYTFGASAVLKLNPLFALESDLAFTRKGTKLSGRYALMKELGSNDEFIYRLDYISIPLFAKVYLPTESAFKPHAELGASFNFLAASELEFTRDPSSLLGARHFKRDISNETNSFDLGLLLGLGADYHLSSGILSLEARYDMGLTNVDQGIGSGPVKNSALLLIAGYSVFL